MVWQFESEIEKFALFAWHFQREFDEGDVPARIHAKTKWDYALDKLLTSWHC